MTHIILPPTTFSLAYTMWVPWLRNDPHFDSASALSSFGEIGERFTDRQALEAICVNVLGVALVAAAVCVAVIVGQPRFRYRPSRVVAVSHDRYG